MGQSCALGVDFDPVSLVLQPVGAARQSCARRAWRTKVGAPPRRHLTFAYQPFHRRLVSSPGDTRGEEHVQHPGGGSSTSLVRFVHEYLTRPRQGVEDQKAAFGAEGVGLGRGEVAQVELPARAAFPKGMGDPSGGAGQHVVCGSRGRRKTKFALAFCCPLVQGS